MTGHMAHSVLIINNAIHREEEEEECRCHSDDIWVKLTCLALQLLHDELLKKLNLPQAEVV